VQDLVRERPRDDPPAGHDPGVVRGPLGHEAVLDQPGVVGARLLRQHLAHRRIEQLHRLDVAPPPADVGDRDDPDAGPRLLGPRRLRLGLREEHDRRRRVLRRPDEVAVARAAAADLQVDHPVLEPVARHQLAVDRQPFLVRQRVADLERVERALQPRQVPAKSISLPPSTEVTS
jgi:hypothetical protein